MSMDSWRDRRVPRYETADENTVIRASMAETIAFFVALVLVSASIGGYVVWIFKDGIRAWFGW